MEEDDEFIELFNNMGYSFTYSDELLCLTEKFVCKFYNYNDVSKVNEARLNSFQLGNYDEQTMPCNLDSLKKHLSRSVYQTAIWRRALTPIMDAPDPSNHGWTVQTGIVSISWMDLPAAPDAILENVKCGCSKGCTTNRCSCFKANLGCTSLCRCKSCTNGSQSVRNSDQESDLDSSDDSEDDS